MSKPLRDTFLGRVLLFFRGIVFYNTVDWKRASDGLKPPRLSRSEREMSRPPRDLSAIKPREKPRAKLSTETEGEDLPPDTVSRDVAKIAPRTSSRQTPLPEPAPAAETEEIVVRKKRRRVRLQSYNSLESLTGPAPDPEGLLARFFKKKG